MADDDFVLKTYSTYQSAETLNQLCPSVPIHVVVYKYDERKRKTLFGKNLNFLFDAIIKKTELFSSQVRDKISNAVSHTDRENHKVGGNANPRLRLLLLPRRRRFSPSQNKL